MPVCVKSLIDHTHSTDPLILPSLMLWDRCSTLFFYSQLYLTLYVLLRRGGRGLPKWEGEAARPPPFFFQENEILKEK